ncbi:MAG: hypothetical protein WC728_06685 [Elusimicrobiota bacterium]
MNAWERFLDLFSDTEDPNEPAYDPVQLGGTVVVCMVAIGCLYWLLWTLLVFEGGIFLKAQALFAADAGADAFEGWFGNVAALALCVAVVAALRKLHVKTKRKAP